MSPLNLCIPFTSNRCLYFISALQTSDPDWYSALTSVLTSEQANTLQEVFHQAEQRKASLGKKTEEYCS